MKKILLLILLLPGFSFGQVAKHNSSGVNTFLDTRYVNITGDTMTGELDSSGKLNFKYDEGTDAADGTHYYSFVTSATVGPTSAASDEISNLYARYRWYTGDNSNAVINGVLGECSSHGADESITCNGGQFISYAVPGASIRSYKGLVASARSSYLGGTANTADSGTAFIGADIWMAPYFTGASTPNITSDNFAGIRIWNEHASIPVANGIILGSGGGGYLHDIHLQNGETIDNLTDGTLNIRASTLSFTGPQLNIDSSSWTCISGECGIQTSPETGYALTIGGGTLAKGSLKSNTSIEAGVGLTVPQRVLITIANDTNVPVIYAGSSGQMTLNSQGVQSLSFNTDKGGVIVMGNALQLKSHTLAEIQASTPTAAGQKFYCSDCTVTPEVVSTGTTNCFDWSGTGSFAQPD
jgi:hypothetical protein